MECPHCKYKGKGKHGHFFTGSFAREVTLYRVEEFMEIAKMYACPRCFKMFIKPNVYRRA